MGSNITHGHNRRGKRTTEYEIWAGIRARVDNPNGKLYPYYGGRGITYDKAWDDFNVFLEEVGYRPSEGHSIDRIDNDKGYFKDNVRWATRAEQSSNRRNNIIVEGITLKAWCLDRGYNYKTVWRWLAREGKTLDYAKEKGEQLWAKDQPSRGYLAISTVHP